jgi:hypothetical protein
MVRVVTLWLLAGLTITGCTDDAKRSCPDAFTPTDVACAERWCDEHPGDARCATLTTDASTATAAGGACQTHLACPAASPRCEAGSCAGCRDAADCAHLSDTPACGPDGACVACTGTSATLCSAQGQVCAAAATRCVECNVGADCKAPERPVCALEACRGCTADAECGAGKVCLEDSGRCVECMPDARAPERETCANGRACDPETFTCTGQPRRSLDLCGKSVDAVVGVARCISDSECTVGHRCVLTQFPLGSMYGSYCLPEIGDGTCPDRLTAKRTATSTLGVTGAYCFPNDMRTTCEGIWSFKSTCRTAADCGARDVDDGRCEEGRCTYSCDSDSDCTSNCIGRGASAGPYCNPN